MKKYSEELKEKVVKLHLSEGRSKLSLEKEFNLSKGCVANWVKLYRKECQNDTKKQGELDFYAENLKLKQQIAELEKENNFLKKAAAFFAKEVK